jgi:uncharacterized cupredoxin-like copper-binding protein
MRLKFFCLILGLVFHPLGFAHSVQHKKTVSSHASHQQEAWGIAGNLNEIDQTIQLVMSDDMAFSPNKIFVKLGETVRFKIKNNGKIMHEMVIGTKPVLDQHAELMMKYPNMEHDEPYMTHLSPSKSGEIVWKFNRAGTFYFACLIPGHYQAGMVGQIEVKL